MNGLEKWILTVAGALGGLWSLLVDGLGLAVVTLGLFMVIDYISGLAQAFYNKDLNSEVGFRGLVKKVYYLLLVGACYAFENLVFGTRHLADGVAISFVAMEFISITENGVRMNAPFSGAFKTFLAIVKKKTDEKGDDR
ncbi:phage holin family protein [Halalkalibacterium halodurans]|uniref:phage holin family protein n=1 Tax=Halalkalibacterium halodurans TaxID=86665 RepID=UPI002AA9CB2B|nr:phage holin family protein [Halalkalibacterium halodurans]MDY7222095.1 phage holin family protein [Halalkalibacterium halodurans]MDY7243886.1 phage holin family protein [Halalkalibacterium halodurans]